MNFRSKLHDCKYCPVFPISLSLVGGARQLCKNILKQLLEFQPCQHNLLHFPPSSAPVFEPAVFRLSPLIRITLLSLYTALTIPLPFLSEVTKAAVPPAALWAAIVVGAVGLYGVASERVILSEEGIEVTYPKWFPRFFRKGWSLPWTEVKALKPRFQPVKEV